METLLTTENGIEGNVFDDNTQKDGFHYRLIAQSNDIKIERRDNFPQGCSFSPDGLCILTATVGDSKLRLYNTPSSLLGNNKIEEDALDVSTENISTNATVEKSPIRHTLTHDEHERTVLADVVEVEKWSAALSSGGGDSIRSYAWYPFMSSNDPATCCFAAVSRDQPIHLYDAYTGAIRASYSPYNALDEMESPMVVAFSPDGQKILGCGFRTDRTIFSFDSTRPGRDAVAIYRLGKTRRSSDGQKGLISSIDFQQPNFSPSGNRIFAVGTYSPGSIYVYDDRIISATQHSSGTILTGACIVGHGKGHYRKKRRFLSLVDSEKRTKSNYDVDTDEPNDWINSAKSAWYRRKTQGGVSQLRFAPTNEYFLYSASRRANTILAWDLRMLSGIDDYQTKPVLVMKSYETCNDTNQRIDFDFNRETGNTLYVGGQDSCVRVYDVTTGNLKARMDGFDDVVNGVSLFRGFANRRPILATATGSRYFPSISDDGNLASVDANLTSVDVSNDTTSIGLTESRPEGVLSMFAITAE